MTVCEAVPVLPQPSATVQLFVVEYVQPEPDSEPTVPVAVNPVEQLSDTDALPKAAAICEAVGLQLRADAAARVIAGASVSTVYINV